MTLHFCVLVFTSVLQGISLSVMVCMKPSAMWRHGRYFIWKTEVSLEWSLQFPNLSPETPVAPYPIPSSWQDQCTSILWEQISAGWAEFTGKQWRLHAYPSGKWNQRSRWGRSACLTVALLSYANTACQALRQGICKGRPYPCTDSTQGTVY